MELGINRLFRPHVSRRDRPGDPGRAGRLVVNVGDALCLFGVCATVLAVAVLMAASSVALAGDVPPHHFLQFDGTSTYVEAPDSTDFGVATTGALTVSAWVRPDTLTFPQTEGSGYVYWLGKGGRGQYEWAFRMYSQDNTEHRGNRISFYVFNLRGGLGIGSYFEDPLTPGEWIHVVGVVDGNTTAIYKNGVYRRCDQFQGDAGGACERHAADGTITPQHGSAPLRIGTLNKESYFQGALAQVRIWNRALAPSEIAALYAQAAVPAPGSVADYQLDDGSGSVAHDTAGGHDATVYGASWSARDGCATPESMRWGPPH